MVAGGLTRKVGIVAVGRAASTFSIFAINAILVRAWTGSDIGIYRALWLLCSTFVPIFLLGLPTSLLYFFPRRSRPARGGLILQAFACLLISGLVLVALLYWVGTPLSRWLGGEVQAGGPGLHFYLLPFLPYIFTLVAGGFAEAALVAAERPHWQAGLALGTAVGMIGVALVGAKWGAGIREVMLAFSCVGGMRLLLALGLVWRAVGISTGGWKKSSLGKFLAYARPIGIGDAVGSLSRYVDRFVVLICFTAGETFAEYELGAIEIPVSLLLAGVVTVLIPEVSRLYKEGELQAIGDLWKGAVGRLSLLVLPLFFFLFAFAEPVFDLYITEKYPGARWVLRIFLLALPLRCAVYNPLLVGMGKAKWALWGSLGDLFLNLSLSVLLVKLLLAQQSEYAFLGPAVAAVVATYAQVFLLVGLIAWHLKWKVSQLLPWGRLLRVGSFSCGAALVGLWVATLGEVALARLLLGGGAFSLTLGGLLWISPEERGELVKIFRALTRS
ncbi:MAG: oligosaccharide flippase family protein [Gemmatimonadetes bacterium]|jgi:O-antigen/teichoic acid export membrane protein|nr:oligosaccharide flippase family protein [Gemmatimonadota bacterium]